MRLRTHILTSGLLGVALYPRAPRKAALLLAGGVLLDADHYLLYALRSGNWNPLSALRYDRWRNQPSTIGDRRRRYGSLRSIFAQDYALLAPAIDIFTPLIYGTKSDRPSTWGRAFLEAAPAFVPRDRKLQLILDALDGSASLLETAAAAHPSWGLQVFDGASIFADPARAQVFQSAVAQIRRIAAG